MVRELLDGPKAFEHRADESSAADREVARERVRHRKSQRARSRLGQGSAADAVADDARQRGGVAVDLDRARAAVEIDAVLEGNAVVGRWQSRISRFP